MYFSLKTFVFTIVAFQLVQMAHLVTWRHVTPRYVCGDENARRTLIVKNSHQMLRAHSKRTERRRKVKSGKGERIGVNRKGVDSNARCDKTRQNSFFLMCKKKRRRGERGEGEGEGGGGSV